MSRIRLPESLLSATFRQLRECGDGKRECVAYWCVDRDEPDDLLYMVHPSHSASAGGYEVDSDWVTQFFLDLRRDRRAVRVQVHTHPGQAGHSHTDDTYSLVPATGFLSLVLPRFADGPITLDDAALVEMTPDGTWRSVAPDEVFDRV